MNTPVSLKIAKLLKEKGFDNECKLCVEDGDERPLPFNCGNTMHRNSLHPYYSAPTITEVVMWLYEKHGIWISVDWMTRTKPHNSGFYCYLRGTNKRLNHPPRTHADGNGCDIIISRGLRYLCRRAFK